MSLTIITAASSNHASCAVNLLWTVRHFEAGSRVIFYDLGLTGGERAAALAYGAEMRSYHFEKHPSWVRNLKQFAWKADLFEEVARETERGDSILWLDAGSLLTGPLVQVKEIIARDGVYCPSLYERKYSECCITPPPPSCFLDQWTNPETFEKLGIGADDPVRQAPTRLTTIVGMNPFAPGMREVIDTWKTWSLDQDIIAPPATRQNRSHHHFDMSLFTIALERSRARHGFQVVDEMKELMVQNDTLSLEQVQKAATTGESYRHV